MKYMKVALLIPSTSHGRNWAKFEETYLFRHTLKTFLITYNKEHEYKFFIGIDRGDHIYDKDEIKEQIQRMMSVMKNVTLEFIYMEGISKGHLTIMWNRLYDRALDEGYDYFFQCGDDIEFRTSNWVNDCIYTLEKNNNMGVTGPINNNARILTQTFVSRKHKELFSYYFPTEIINWCCDDWINDVYKRIGHFYPLRQHFCENVGGQPRYNINNDAFFAANIRQKMQSLRQQCAQIVERDYVRTISKKNGIMNSV